MTSQETRFMFEDEYQTATEILSKHSIDDLREKMFRGATMFGELLQRIGFEKYRGDDIDYEKLYEDTGGDHIVVDRNGHLYIFDGYGNDYVSFSRKLGDTEYRKNVWSELKKLVAKKHMGNITQTEEKTLLNLLTEAKIKLEN